MDFLVLDDPFISVSLYLVLVFLIFLIFYLFQYFIRASNSFLFFMMNLKITDLTINLRILLLFLIKRSMRTFKAIIIHFYILNIHFILVSYSQIGFVSIKYYIKLKIFIKFYSSCFCFMIKYGLFYIKNGLLLKLNLLLLSLWLNFLLNS